MYDFIPCEYFLMTDDLFGFFNIRPNTVDRSETTTYIERLREAAEAAIPALNKWGIEAFKDTLEVPHRIRVPSQANTEFQRQQALGDWAEANVKDGVNQSKAEVQAVPYGDNSKMHAEDEGFRDFYKASVARTYVEGKRPDLLLLDACVEAPNDCTNLSDAETRKIVKPSIGGLEIRASRYEVQLNKEYKNARLVLNRKYKPNELTFTVKIEDLKKVYVWCVTNGKPQAYVQVFFDEVYGLSFLDILKYIGTAAKPRVNTPKRSGKSTIMVPIGLGKLIGKVTMVPDYELVDNIAKNGRHDTFAAPKGGKIEIDAAAVRSLLCQ